MEDHHIMVRMCFQQNGQMEDHIMDWMCVFSLEWTDGRPPHHGQSVCFQQNGQMEDHIMVRMCMFSVEVMEEKPHHEVKNTEDFSVSFQFNGQVGDHIMDRLCDFRRTCGWKRAKRIPKTKLTEGRRLPGQNVYVSAGLMDVFHSLGGTHTVMKRNLLKAKRWTYPYLLLCMCQAVRRFVGLCTLYFIYFGFRIWGQSSRLLMSHVCKVRGSWGLSNVHWI